MPPTRRGGSSAARSFFRLWIAQVVSSLGDWIGLIAILAIAARVSEQLGRRGQPRDDDRVCCPASSSAPSAA